jgi:hypothetical protein
MLITSKKVTGPLQFGQLVRGKSSMTLLIYAQFGCLSMGFEIKIFMGTSRRTQTPLPIVNNHSHFHIGF